jgi:hypothetical protein
MARCMKMRCLSLAAAAACAALPWGAMAQASAPAPMAAASASPVAKPGPRRLTPQESRDSATAPGDLRPEHAVVPQINIPFGKKQAAPLKPQSNAGRSANASRSASAASAAGIDDAVARCEAESDKQVRASCRARLARQDRTR